MGYNDITEADKLNGLLGEVLAAEEPRLPLLCPMCGAYPPSAHIYFLSRGHNKMGGIWIWCDQCKVSLHGSFHPPAWWSSLPSIDIDQITSHPVYLNKFVTEIDAHWNQFMGNRE
jgi:hypothetical protein